MPRAARPIGQPGPSERPNATAWPADVAAVPPPQAARMHQDQTLTARRVGRCYGATVALAGVDLTLRRGESLAVMGPSGSGKSTLLHSLAGVEVPDQGEVRLGDERIDQMGERERAALRRRRFGFVFQSGHLLPELPAVENVALPLVLDGWSRRRAVAEAGRWFAPLGI